MILQCTMERDEGTGTLDVMLSDEDKEFLVWMPAITFQTLFGFTPKRDEVVKMDAKIEVKRL